ncbi:MAG TPA: hypothetical protein VGM93_00165, partial [Acidimicrobiales bacterium]
MATNSQPASAATGSITGTVFRDFNSDGVMNLTSTPSLPAVDVGEAGVTVTAVGPTGAQVGATTTAANGTYTLTYSATGPSTAVRVEFTTPAGYQSGPSGGSGAGVRSGTSVQFKVSGDTANYGISQQGDFAQTNPTLIIPVHRGVQSDKTLAPTTTGALYAVNYSTTGIPSEGSGSGNLRVQATAGQIGTVWGVAPY